MAQKIKPKGEISVRLDLLWAIYRENALNTGAIIVCYADFCRLMQFNVDFSTYKLKGNQKILLAYTE